MKFKPIKPIAKAIDAGLFNDAFRRASVHAPLLKNADTDGGAARVLEALHRERRVPLSSLAHLPETPRFVGGSSGRSGTTWLTRLIAHQVSDTHAVIGEQGLFVLGLMRSAPYEYYQFGGIQAGRERYLAFFENQIRRWAYKRRRVYGYGLKGLMRYVPGRAISIAMSFLKDELIGVDTLPAVEHAFGRFYARLLGYHAAVLFGEPAPWVSKEPPYGRHAAELIQMIPEARLVLMVRDGREVALSMFKRRWMDTIRACMQRWAEFAAMTLESVDRAPAERVRMVRYDDLVGDFPRVLGDTFSFLRLPPPNPEAILASDDSRLAPRAESIRRWETEIPREDLEWFAEHYGDINARYGYCD